MGFDLKSETGEEVQWTGVYWRLMLQTAEYYGWKPTGTSPPEGVAPDEWDGSHFTNEGQLVTADDAADLARALDESGNADDLEEVSNAIYAGHMREAYEEADRLLQRLSFAGEPRGLVARLKRALGFMRKDPPSKRETREIAHIKRVEMSSALNELRAFSEKGAFRIW